MWFKPHQWSGSYHQSVNTSSQDSSEFAIEDCYRKVQGLQMDGLVCGRSCSGGLRKAPKKKQTSSLTGYLNTYGCFCLLCSSLLSCFLPSQTTKSRTRWTRQSPATLQEAYVNDSDKQKAESTLLYEWSRQTHIYTKSLLTWPVSVLFIFHQKSSPFTSF